MEGLLFADERTKLYFGYSFLAEDARVLACPHVVNDGTWRAMVEALGSAYGLQQRRAKLEKDLLNLMQGA